MHVIRKLPDRTLNLYQDGILNELLTGFNKAVSSMNTSVVLIIDGRSGMGKSTLAFQVGITLDPNFSLNKIHFAPETFLEGGEGKIGLANAKEGDCIVFDEAMIISNRSAMSQINKMIIQAMSMIRSKRIYVIFCVNSVFDLDKNLALHRADALFHVYGESLISRGRFGAFFKGQDGFDRLKELYLRGKKLYDYSRPQSNFIGRFTKEFIVNEQEYEIQKQKGVNAFLKGGKKNKLDRNDLIKKLYNEKGWEIKDISEFVGLTERQIYNILQNNG